MLQVNWGRNTSPKLAYDNYEEDIRPWQRYVCSYESHLTNIIDKILDNDSQHISDTVVVDAIDMSTMVNSKGNKLADRPDTCQEVLFSSKHTKDNNEM